MPDILFLKHDSSILRQVIQPCMWFVHDGTGLSLCCLSDVELAWLFHEPHTELEDCLNVHATALEKGCLARARMRQFVNWESFSKTAIDASVTVELPGRLGKEPQIEKKKLSRRTNDIGAISSQNSCRLLDQVPPLVPIQK